MQTSSSRFHLTKKFKPCCKARVAKGILKCITGRPTCSRYGSIHFAQGELILWASTWYNIHAAPRLTAQAKYFWVKERNDSRCQRPNVNYCPPLLLIGLLPATYHFPRINCCRGAGAKRKVRDVHCLAAGLYSSLWNVKRNVREFRDQDIYSYWMPRLVLVSWKKGGYTLTLSRLEGYVCSST